MVIVYKPTTVYVVYQTSGLPWAVFTDRKLAFDYKEAKEKETGIDLNVLQTLLNP